MPFQIPYTCTLSPILREAVHISGKKEILKEQIEGCVETINNDSDIASSLKTQIVPGTKIFRQIDIRLDSDNSILFKNFIFWNFDLNCWHVLTEGATETYWEDYHGKPINPLAN